MLVGAAEAFTTSTEAILLPSANELPKGAGEFSGTVEQAIEIDITSDSPTTERRTLSIMNNNFILQLAGSLLLTLGLFDSEFLQTILQGAKSESQ